MLDFLEQGHSTGKWFAGVVVDPLMPQFLIV